VGGSSVATASSPVGTYPIVPTATGTNLGNYTVVYVNGTLTVGQASLTVTATNATRTYGATNPSFTGTYTGAVNGDTFTVGGSSVATASSPVGAYPIVPTATGTNLGNYTVVYVNGTLTVGQASLTVTATNATRIYGAANPSFTGTYSGAVNGDTFTVGGSSVATASSPVGTYPIVPTATGTNLSDYTVVYVNGTLTVGQASLTVTATNATRIYGTANPSFTGTYTGAVNGDTFTVGGSSVATASSPVGTYPIVPTATGTNLSDYTVVYVNGTLTVGQASLTVTAGNATRIYGAANPSFTASAVGAVNGDTFTFSETTPAIASSPVGTYPIVPTATGTNLSDYTVVYVNGTLTVGQASLTVTAGNATRIYGAANPTFTASAVGAVNGDTFTFTETTPATTSSQVGTYPIVPVATGTNLSDYTVVYVNGTLTINQATPVITWANPAPVVYGTALGLAQLNATASVPGAMVYTPAAGSIPTAGTDTLMVTFTPTDTTNYTTATKTVQLTVNQATPVITWANPASIVYGTALSSIQLDATASVPGSFVYAPAAGTEFMVGLQQLSVTFTPTDLANYTPATKTVSLNVTQAVLTIEANNFTRLYGTPNPTFTGIVTGAQDGDIFTETFSNSASTLSTVGQYPIIPSVTGTDLADYSQVVQNGTLSITKAPTVTTTTLSTTSIAYELNVTSTATVASTTSGTPTGTVNFFDNGTPLGSGTLSNGVATFNSASLPVGTNVITAVYSGDVNFTSSTASGASGTNTVLITPLDFSIQLTSAATVEGVYGTTRQFTFHISPIGGTYPGVVQLSANPSGPILATYTFSPASIGKTAGPMDITLTVATRKLASSESPKDWASKLSPIALGLFLLPLLGRRSRRSARKMTRLITYSALLLLSLGAIGTMTGCGAGYFAHNYPITVTATSNGVQHTVSVDYQIDQSPQ
ncbi:MAG TPA: MBG domain-containing protein, partial [Edaphobacter sp.]|nr:MBG domain-containing protein [Edaphobacter sp.]